jgi:hypothetical protein
MVKLTPIYGTAYSARYVITVNISHQDIEKYKNMQIEIFACVLPVSSVIHYTDNSSLHMLASSTVEGYLCSPFLNFLYESSVRHLISQ